MKKIKVKIDTSPLSTGHAVRGIGQYTRELINALEKNSEVEVVEKNYDIVHYPFFDLFFDTLPDPKGPTVVMVHDVIPLLYPAHHKPGIRGSLRFSSQKRKLQKVDAITADSETSKKDIVRMLDIPAEKIFPTHLSHGNNFKKLKAGKWEKEVKQRYNLPDKFVLYVGDINYNKNIPGLLRALVKLNDENLVLAGKAFLNDIPEAREIRNLVKELHLEGRVTMTGFVPDEDIVKVYNLATVFCTASFYEGFGLPLLEAMACGVPVVSSKTQALVEIGGDGALYADPKNPNDIAAGLKEVLGNIATRDKLVSSGYKNVKRFSWERTANETVKVYKKVLGI